MGATVLTCVPTLACYSQMLKAFCVLHPPGCRHMLAILAAHHGIPFFVAAPTTTLDQNMPDGSHIEIEQRPAEEITHFKGQRVVVEQLNGNILKVGAR